MNVCYLNGWVVGTGALPSDPSEHDAPGLPIHGCNNLACSKCKRTVRTAVCASGVIDAGAQPRHVHEVIPALHADAKRLATRLDGTPYQERVVAAARHLTSADLATRVRAVHFFADTVRFVEAMRPAILLGEHAALFVGIPNPHSNLQTTKTLNESAIPFWLKFRPQGAPSTTADGVFTSQHQLLLLLS